MFTSQRIAALASRYGCTPTADDLHEVMNAFDAIAGIDTSGGIKPAPLGRSGIVAVNYIGARLALHEQRVAHNRWDEMDSAPEKYFHWLGHGACCSCGCGEHRRL
jgi:hypothetical protein